MVFRRRDPLTWWARLRQQTYPKGGFRRALAYHWHRLRRLPDAPHRIARGVFAGTFVNFPPIPGIQLPAAILLAWAMRGNILAAALATLLSNPLTTPLIALGSLRFGYWLLGTGEDLNVTLIFAAFAEAGQELWHNLRAAFGPEVAHWQGLAVFWHRIYLPYLVGSILPGLVVSGLLAWATVPVLTGYQRLRQRRAAARREKLRGISENGDDDTTPFA